MMKARMMVSSGDDRDRHLDALARYLGDDDQLVVAIDTYRENDATLHVPLDPAAEVVAYEPPRIQADGATEVVSYVVCRGTTTFRRVLVRDDGSTAESEVDVAAARRVLPGGVGAGAAAA